MGIQYQPKYLEDFDQMTEVEKERVDARCGKIDTGAVFAAIFGKLPYESLNVIGPVKVDQILDYLTMMNRVTRKDGSEYFDSKLHSCYQDVLRLEFGQESCKVADLLSVNDYYETASRMQMEQKLIEALEMIAGTSVTLSETWSKCQQEVHFGELNFEALAAAAFTQKNAGSWADRVKNVCTWNARYFWNRIQPWERDLLRMEFGRVRVPLAQVATEADSNLLQAPIEVMRITLDRLLEQLNEVCRRMSAGEVVNY